MSRIEFGTFESEPIDFMKCANCKKTIMEFIGGNSWIADAWVRCPKCGYATQVSDSICTNVCRPANIAV